MNARRYCKYTYNDHCIQSKTLSRADGRARAIPVLDVVCVSAEHLRALVTDAVREGLGNLERQQVEPDAVVSLDQAAKLMRRRRSAVLQSVLAGVM